MLTRQASRLRRIADAARALSHPPDAPRIFGVGAAKTGTHTLGEMFADRVPSAHEADAERLISLYLDAESTGDDAALVRYLRWRGLSRGLKIDASQINIYLIPQLERLFPDSRYILTVREPQEWLRSIIDDSLRRDVSDTWTRFRDYRFAATFTVHDGPMKARGLFPVAGYLAYWKDAIDRVLVSIPTERRMIVRTDEITARSGEIAEFCGLDGGPAAPLRAFANSERFGVLDDLDPAYLEAELRKVLTPEIRDVLKPSVPHAEELA